MEKIESLGKGNFKSNFERGKPMNEWAYSQRPSINDKVCFSNGL